MCPRLEGARKGSAGGRMQASGGGAVVEQENDPATLRDRIMRPPSRRV
jgi:hypothetical protein